MSLKETIQAIAQSLDIDNLSEEVAAALSSDVEYRLREIIQGAIKCMLHSKRTILTTDDVNNALQFRNIEPVHGFGSGVYARFRRAVGHSDVLYVDDGEVKFKEASQLPENGADYMAFTNQDIGGKEV